MLDSDFHDELIEEIPVFLSKSLQHNLHVFQYPIQSPLYKKQKMTVVNSRFKPENQIVMLNIAVDTNSTSYDSSKSQILSTDFAIGNDFTFFTKGIQSLIGSQALNNVYKYLVGIYSEKEIHLTPVMSVFKLRPSISYIESSKRYKGNQKKNDKEITGISVKFSRISTEISNRVKGIRETYNTFMENILSESWYEMNWYEYTTINAELERQRLYATTRNKISILSLNHLEYGKRIFPRGGSQKGIEFLLPPKVFCWVRLLGLPLIDQIKIILSKGGIMTLDEVFRIVKKIIDDDSVTMECVLRCLVQVGVLMHGNWVVQSEVLYPIDKTVSKFWINFEQLARGRDYILFRFSREKYLVRQHLINATHLSSDVVFNILNSIAFLNMEKKWELLLPPNSLFQQLYPDLVQRQELVWRASEQAYNEMDRNKPCKRIRKKSRLDSKPYSVELHLKQTHLQRP